MHQKMEESKLRYNAVYSNLIAQKPTHMSQASFVQYEVHLGAVVTVTPVCLDPLGAAQLLPQMDQILGFICVSSCVMRPNGMAGPWFYQAATHQLPQFSLMSLEQLWGLRRLFYSDLTL